MAALRIPAVRRLLISNSSASMAGRALAVVVGYQVYDVTKDPFALGMLGLVEAVPSLSLALYGGHVADRHDRRAILSATRAALVICALLFSLLVGNTTGAELPILYTIVFIAGIARGFADPAATALEAQHVPRELMVRTAAWFASSWLVCAVLGPVLGGLVYSVTTPSFTYLLIALLYAVAWLGAYRLPSSKPPPVPPGESIMESLTAGVRYVARDQILLGSMALDLFAVLFGGAIALLPVFAADILHVGAVGLGVLNAAPAAGALATMLWATRNPPITHAGRNLLFAVGGFGIAMIGFALSTNFYLSLFFLTVAGICDGVSVVIRRSIVRLLSPEHLRGRIAAVSMIFIGSSNELGAFESGIAASALGTVRSVWVGGLVTLAVVAFTASVAPRLRRLSLEPQNLPPH